MAVGFEALWGNEDVGERARGEGGGEGAVGEGGPGGGC